MLCLYIYIHTYMLYMYTHTYMIGFNIVQNSSTNHFSKRLMHSPSLPEASLFFCMMSTNHKKNLLFKLICLKNCERK